jgi:hypothetical protein
MTDGFDVFLSHNGRDKPIVEEIGAWLKGQGLRVWLDKWELRPGLPWQEGLEEGVQSSRAGAVFVGADGLGPWQEPEMRAFLAQSRRKKIPVIPVLLPGCPETPQLTLFLEGFTWVDLRKGVTEEGLAQLVWVVRLEQAGVSTANWGKAQAKTPQDLVKEIKDEETILVNDENGQLIRSVAVVNADVYYKAPDGGLFRLKEDRQIFADSGRERRRDLGAAVSEKMKANEGPAEAMIRGIREELGLVGPIAFTEEGTTQETTDSPSYPGLRSRYTRHKFRIILNSGQYQPEGYTETQAGKITYFLWEKLV